MSKSQNERPWWSFVQSKPGTSTPQTVYMSLSSWSKIPRLLPDRLIDELKSESYHSPLYPDGVFAQFAKLPPELLVRCWQYLNLADIKAVRGVSRDWFRLCESNATRLAKYRCYDLHIIWNGQYCRIFEKNNRRRNCQHRPFTCSPCGFLNFMQRLCCNDDVHVTVNFATNANRFFNMIVNPALRFNLKPKSLHLSGNLSSATDLMSTIELLYSRGLEQVSVSCTYGLNDTIINDRLFSSQQLRRSNIIACRCAIGLTEHAFLTFLTEKATVGDYQCDIQFDLCHHFTMGIFARISQIWFNWHGDEFGNAGLYFTRITFRLIGDVRQKVDAEDDIRAVLPAQSGEITMSDEPERTFLTTWSPKGTRVWSLSLFWSFIEANSL